MICVWIKKYLEQGESALENKKKPGNPLSKYSRKKNQNMKLGENILKLTKDLKFSQEQLAEKVNVTRQTISNWV